MAKGGLFGAPTVTAMAVLPVYHPGGEVSLGDCEDICYDSADSRSCPRHSNQAVSGRTREIYAPFGRRYSRPLDFQDPRVPPLSGTANGTRGRALFDVTAYIRKHVDVLQFLPADPLQPVRLFTVSSCTSRLKTLSGGVVVRVASYGRRTFRRTRAVLTGTENSAPRPHVASGSAVLQCTEDSDDIENRSASGIPTRNEQARQNHKDCLAAELSTKGLWSFARCEAVAEALLRRTEREWRNMAEFFKDARAQTGAAAKALLEAALRKIDEASDQDLTDILTELRCDLESVRGWFAKERAFVEESAHFAVVSGRAIPPVTANLVELNVPSTPQNEYVRLLEENPGAKRFLERAAARKNRRQTLAD
ncbi:hypothetical protein KFL_000110390 [Klebsormidium nitens]|uniref:Uncharacterized protein n=1 Tax=Klebsormidium nitens TaxID=105231 RepID=A0A1Y1HL30_KLENI|nr:hypothetical protein KFL_000110390 [Klebsormidium nitens]|eukprot:GAQ78342.1 hypothetical protein KFL_000110390 [Klebsormidium nitens]